MVVCESDALLSGYVYWLSVVAAGGSAACEDHQQSQYDGCSAAEHRTDVTTHTILSSLSVVGVARFLQAAVRLQANADAES